MTKIFKQLGRHWAACLAVVALLIVQAYCDLSLPDYTSKIVDTGIQQGGIESPVPDTVRSTTLQALELLMSEDDAALADEAYADPDADGMRTLKPDADTAALENAFTTPDVVLYMAAVKNAATAAGTTDTVVPTAYDLDAVATQLAAASQAPGAREMLQSQLTDGLAQLDETVADSLSSQAMLLVALEYDAQGIAHDVQMSYLLRTGGQMLALTLLMVAVAVAVGFIASRVSAAIGRDLRRDVFRTVVGYSNAEIEKFSTASLITRTTNDIQQVQFVCVILLRMVAYAPILGIGGIMHVASGNTGLEWIIFVAVAALLALIAVLMNVAMPKFKQMQVLVDRLNLVSREILTGIMPIRAFSREAFDGKMGALFFDIDDTLLSGVTKKVPESALEGIRKVKENGHKVLINTGRTICSVPPIIKKLDVDGFLCGCGTYLIYKNEVLFESHISIEEGNRYIDLMKQYHIEGFLEGTDDMYFSERVSQCEPVESTRRYMASMGLGRETSMEKKNFEYDKLLIHINKKDSNCTASLCG